MKKVLTASVLALSLASAASFAVAGNPPKAEAYAETNGSSAPTALIAGSQSQSSGLQTVVNIVQAAAGSLGKGVGSTQNAAPSFDNNGNLTSPLEIFALNKLLSQPQISALQKAVIDHITNENNNAGRKFIYKASQGDSKNELLVIYVISQEQSNPPHGYAIAMAKNNKGPSITVQEVVVGKHIVEQLTAPGKNGRGNTAPIGLIAGEKN